MRAPLIILGLAIGASIFAAGVHHAGLPDDQDAYAVGYATMRFTKAQQPGVTTNLGKSGTGKQWCGWLYDTMNADQSLTTYDRRDFVQGCEDAWAGRQAKTGAPDELNVAVVVKQ